MAATLSEPDVRRLTRALNALADVTDVSSFPREAMRACAAVVKSDIIAYNEIHPTDSLVEWWPDPSVAPDDSPALIARLAEEHPIIQVHARTGNGAASAISDYLSDEQFRRLDLYKVFFEPFGLVDQLAIGLPAPQPLIIGVTMNRKRRGFEGRERLMADLMRPYLVQAHRTVHLAAALAATSALGLDNRTAVLTGPNGDIEPVMGVFPDWLPADEVFPGARLNDESRGWLKAQIMHRAGVDDLPPLEAPLVLTTRGGRWVLRHVTTKAGHVVVLTRAVRSATEQQCVLCAMGLTEREAEVLYLLSQGATNARIAASLSISLSAVKRHLESVYRKLGVTNRSEATALTVDTIAHA